METAKAETNNAYELRAKKLQQDITVAEMEVTVVERRKQIEVEAAEVELVAKELQATVRLPAAADAFVTQTLAEGRRTRTLTIAQVAEP